jgi:hypothetical protein
LVALAVVVTVGNILLFALRDDPIGDPVAIALTGADADAILGGADKGFLDPLRFDGGDRGGIYEAFLTLNRS